MKASVIKTLLLLLLCLPAAVLAADNDGLYFLHYTISTGLPSNNVYSIVQDHNGYIWFATDKGAVKYNGYSFQLFNAGNGLPANDVYKLFEDAQGRMWVHTLTTHFGFIKDDEYHDLKFPEQPQNVIYPKSICSDGDGVNFVFLGIDGNHVVHAGDEVEAMVTYDLSRARKDNIYKRDILYPSGKAFLIDSSDVLYEVNVFAPWIPPIRKGYVDHPVQERNRSGMERPWIGTRHYDWYQHNLYIFDEATRHRKVIDIQAISGDSTETIYTADESAGGRLSVMTNKHVYLVDTSGKVLQKIGFQGTDVSQVAFYTEDNAANEWYTTVREGVFVHMNAPGGFYRTSTGISPQAVYKGTIPGGQSFWWNNKTMEMTWTGNSNDVHTRQWKMYGDLGSVSRFSDSVVALSFSNGSILFNYVNGALSPLLSDRYFLREKMYPRADILIDTRSEYSPVGGLHWFRSISRYKDGSIIFFNSTGIYRFFRYADGLPVLEHIYNDRFTEMVQEPVSGKYIFYNTEKVAVLDADNSKISAFNVKDFAVNSLNIVSAIQADSFGNIYVLGNEDFFVFNTAAALRFSLLKLPFRLDNSVITIKDNLLVIAGRYGVAAAGIRGRCDIGEFRYMLNIKDHYYKQVNNMWLNHSNDIYLQTDHGYFSVNADSIAGGFKASEARKTEAISWVLKYPGQRAIKEKDTLVLPPDSKKMVFDVINYLGIGAHLYTYRIPETGENWQTSASGEVLSDKILPGRYYTIELQAKDDIWKTPVTTFYLYRPPYWYQTLTWKIIFLILGIITAGLAVTGVISLIRQSTSRAREKRRILNDLELRAIHAQINPHFIFNTLSTALYFINKKEYDNAYSHVNKFSYLLRSYLKSSHDRYVTLAEELEMLQRYIELQQTRFEEKFDYEFIVDNKVPAGNILIPSLLLQPLIENAINHGLFHKAGKGMLRISFEQGVDNTQLICTVDDDGIGRRESAYIKENNNTGRESYGSRLTEKLISVFRNYEDMGIHIEYIDKEYPYTGTIVKLWIDNIKYQA
ncbi:histidine kinase [Chitinophagaceae bacterium MMS25-I14]